MNPWRAYLLLQDFARWTGTYGGMISSDLLGAESPQMNVVTTPRGERHQRLALGRKKYVAPGRKKYIVYLVIVFLSVILFILLFWKCIECSCNLELT
jgi:hypothetical protein